MRELNIGIIGTKFMGRLHSHVWKNLSSFFDLPFKPRLLYACGRDASSLASFSEKWGWEKHSLEWRDLAACKDVDVLDICTPPNLHYPLSMAGIREGKHILCEKPLAMNASEGREMAEAARDRGIVHYVNHNYRRCPAVVLAKEIISSGKLGRVLHWRGVYMNCNLLDPALPIGWNMVKDIAGSGPLSALNSHSVDLARYLVGEIASVSAVNRVIVPERPVKGGGTGKVTTEDASCMVVEFENGAIGSFDTSRFASGRKNYNSFEIYGSRGSLAFNFERMNELQYHSEDDPPETQGFRTINVSESFHPYMTAWWPHGHPIGYEHTFFHAFTDFIQAVDGNKKIKPDFYDGWRGMQFIDAALKAGETGARVYLKAAER